MIDKACGYDPYAPAEFTAEQEEILRTLSEQDPVRFAIGVGAVSGLVHYEKTPNIKMAQTVIEFMQSFMSDEPLDEDLE